MTNPTALSESSPELKVRIHKPLNVEASFLNPHSPITAAEHFFVRNHFPIPEIDAASWRLEIGGAVDNRISLSLDDLRAMPATTHQCVLECAGNGRLSSRTSRKVCSGASGLQVVPRGRVFRCVMFWRVPD